MGLPMENKNSEDEESVAQQPFQGVLLSADTIAQRVQELGAQISQDYAGRSPVVVCILTGAMMFFSDLVRCIECPITIGTMSISSYGDATKSSGVAVIDKDIDIAVQGRDVLLVEDIIDSGLTLSYLIDVFERRNAHSVKIVALLDKSERRKVEIEPDYRGFEVPNHFLVGYGLDFANRFRQLPYVAILHPDYAAAHSPS
jgi:hypoxanthine phosphoribosyltransferase